MFKVKRPAIIGLLVVLLVFTGYLNHRFTQQAQRRSSRDYINHELAEMDRYLDTEDLSSLDDVEIGETDYFSELDDLEQVDNMDIVDSKDNNIIDSTKTQEQEALETMYSEATMASKNYFVEYRLSRDKLRASLVDRLDEIVKDDKTSESTRDDAQKQIIKIGNISEKELQIEGLIKGRGYDDAIVFLTDDDIKVVVSTPELTDQDMVKILEIIKSETDYDNNNIKIMKKQ